MKVWDPGSVALNAFPMNTTWSFSVYPLTMAFPLYSKPRSSMSLSSVFGVSVAPPPSLAFPNQPLLYSSFNSTSITFSLSSCVATPLNSAASLFLSTTLILSTIFAGRFERAAVGSSKKNVLPPTVILSTFSPFTVTLPSFPTSTPGIFFSKSASMSFSPTLNDDALYIMVSCFTIMAFPAADTVAASRYSAFSSSFMMPRSSCHFLNVYTFLWGR